MIRAVKQAAIWLFAIVASLISVLAATVLVVALIYDWNDLREPAARLASAALGRKVSINGPLDVDLGWTTRIRMGEVSVANAAWAKEPEMLKIAQIDTAIDVRELLSGNIRIPSIALEKPEVILARNEKGETNWTFGDAQSDKPADGERQELPVIDELTVTDGSVQFQQPGPAEDLELLLDQVTLRQPPPDQDIRLDANGQYQNQPFKLTLEAGSFAELKGAEPYPLDLALTAGDLKGTVAGNIGDPAKMQGVDLAIDFKGDNAANLFPMTGLVLPPTPPYHIKGQLKRQGSAWTLADFDGTLGGSDLRGTISVDLAGERRMMRGDLSSNKLDFADLLPAIGAPREQDAGDQPPTSERPGRILPDKDIDLSRLRAMDADVTFRSNRIVTTAIPLDRFEAKLTLDDGTLRLQPVRFEIGQGKVDLYTSLYGSKQPVDVDIDLQIQRLNLKDLLRNTQFAEESAGILGGRAKLASHGTSVADILGGANGEVYVVMSGGQMSLLLVELAGLDIAQALGIAISGDEPTPIRCLVADVNATNGVFETQPLVLDTGDTIIVGSGAINMGDETLNLRLTPYAKDFSPLTLRSPITIGGTLASPDPFPDPAGIGNETLGQKVLNAILTPVLGLLPPFDTEVGTDSDCRSLIEKAKSAEARNARR